MPLPSRWQPGDFLWLIKLPFQSDSSSNYLLNSVRNQTARLCSSPLGIPWCLEGQNLLQSWSEEWVTQWPTQTTHLQSDVSFQKTTMWYYYSSLSQLWYSCVTLQHHMLHAVSLLIFWCYVCLILQLGLLRHSLYASAHHHGSVDVKCAKIVSLEIPETQVLKRLHMCDFPVILSLLW